MALNKGDTQIRELGEVHSSSSPLKKIEFLGPDTAVVLGEDFVEVFVPERCAQYQSCEACHTLSDPHCGWCTLENKLATFNFNFNIYLNCVVLQPWVINSIKRLLHNLAHNNTFDQMLD